MILGHYTPEISASLALIVVISLVIFQFKRANYKLKTWAADNGYAITKVSSRGGRKNPYFFNMKMANVYYVTVKGQGGKMRACWLRIPQYGYDIDCKWEDEQ